MESPANASSPENDLFDIVAATTEEKDEFERAKVLCKEENYDEASDIFSALLEKRFAI